MFSIDQKQEKMNESGISLENTVAGAGLTSVIIAVIWGLQKLIRRSRCASHTKCCDIEVARSETNRGTTDLDLQTTILKILESRDIKKSAPAEAVANESALSSESKKGENI